VSDALDSATLQVAGELLSDNDTFLKRVGRQGPALSRNIGMQSARGQYILFLDDDDAFLPNYLAEAYTATKQDPGYVLYTNPRIVEEDRTKPENAPLRVTDQSMAGMDFQPQEKEWTNYSLKAKLRISLCLVEMFMKIGLVISRRITIN
jgi:glycosyltransferase involved in cell wall biosynthesis